jgi:DNA-binding MarR family transcriptional regulator
VAPHLSFRLHVLVARLDRAADRILRAEHDVSYHRFLALTLVGELGVATQRELAESLGVTEPSVSRMTAVLAADELLDAGPDPAGGRRKRLALTARGRRLVDDGQRTLEERFAALVTASGVSPDRLHGDVDALLAALGDPAGEAGR